MILAALYALIFATSAFFLSSNQSSFLNSATEFLQGLCISRSKSLYSNSSEALASLVCGAPFPEGIEKSQWVSVGLIHLLVVSGGHFLILFVLLEKLHVPAKWVGFLGTIYLLTTGFQPPAFRFLIGFAIHGFIQRYSHKLPSDMITLNSGMCVLILFPEWSQSWSLALSWTAALALAIYEEFHRLQKLACNRKKKPGAKEILFKHTLVFIILFIPLLSFQTPQPLTIVMNVFFAPVLSFLLFPLGLLAMTLGFTISIFDAMWMLTMEMLSLIPMKSLESEKINLSLSWIWFYIFSIHIGFHFYRVLKRRELFSQKDRGPR